MTPPEQAAPCNRAPRVEAAPVVIHPRGPDLVRLLGRSFPRASLAERIAAVIVTAGCLFVLAIALRLDPDPRGVGTHEQLGLPPCGMVAAFGVPCPSCGFTTTFTLAAHGRPLRAAVNQPFGLLLFGLTVVSVPLGIVCVWRGVSWLSLLDRLPLGRVALIALGLWLASWLYKWWMVAR